MFLQAGLIHMLHYVFCTYQSLAYDKCDSYIPLHYFFLILVNKLIISRGERHDLLWWLIPSQTLGIEVGRYIENIIDI